MKLILFLLILSGCVDHLRESDGALSAKCLKEKGYSDSGDSIHHDNIHCLESFALCEEPCNEMAKSCESEYFSRDKRKCLSEKAGPCYKNCKEKFPCVTQLNADLELCRKKKKREKWWIYGL